MCGKLGHLVPLSGGFFEESSCDHTTVTRHRFLGFYGEVQCHSAELHCDDDVESFMKKVPTTSLVLVDVYLL